MVDMMGNADCPSLESFEAGSAGSNSGTFDGMRISDSQMSFGSDFLRMSQPDDLDLLPLQGSGSLEDLAMSGASDFDQVLEMRISGGNYSGGMPAGMSGGAYSHPPAMAPPAPPGGADPLDMGDDVGEAGGGKPPRARKPPPAAGELVMGLPKNKDGRPKPAPPWIAAAVYWIATQPPLQTRTGLTVTPATSSDSPAVFHIISLSVKDKATSRELDNGVVLARLLREIMKLTGSGLKLPCWDAVRKHLSPTYAPNATPPQCDFQGHLSDSIACAAARWWSNPTRGGNKNRDFSQSYQEHLGGSFASQGELLEDAYCELQYKCQLLLEFSIEIAERMENCP